MSWTIRVNFGELFEIGRQFYKYGQALNQMENALENAEKILAENRGLAAKAIMVDTSSMKEKIRKCKKEVSDVQNIIKDYVGDMEEILHPKNENAEMLVDRVDICANIYSMKNVSDQLNFTTMTGAGSGMTGGLSGGGPAADSMVDPGEAATMAANAEKLSDFLAEAAKTRSRLEDKGRELDDIYAKVKRFENRDNDYGMRASQLYDKYSNGKEIAKDQWSALWNNIKGLGKGVLDLAKDTVVGLCKLVYNIGKAGVATQMVAICGLTGTNPPDWAYKELEGIDRTAKTLLYDPMLAVEGLAQSSKDAYQKEGLAYCIGYVGGDVALSILVTKGMTKAGSIGKVGTKLDDVGDVWKVSREHGGAKIIKTIPAEEVNNWWKTEKGYTRLPYTQGKSVRILQLRKNSDFVRVYDGETSKMYGNWIMNAKDIKGLTPTQIKNKYALPSTPKYICDVKLPSNTMVRTGVANKIEGWGSGGGIQYDLQGQAIGTFKNPRPLK